MSQRLSGLWMVINRLQAKKISIRLGVDSTPVSVSATGICILNSPTTDFLTCAAT